MDSGSLPQSGSLPLSTQAVAILTVHVVFLVLTTTAFILRIWSKHIIGAPYHLEDWSVTAALVGHMENGVDLRF